MPIAAEPAVTLDDIKQAQRRLRDVAVRTQLVEFPLGENTGRRLYLKPENLQPVGSFKLRGAYNKIASLSLEERARGVITYSSGNHAQGVAYAARALGVHAVVVMPSNAPAIKRESTESMGAELVFVGPGSEERKQKAEELAAQHGYVIVPPYNDKGIVAGQGTVGLEILEDLPEVELVLTPLGGGGLTSGTATAIKISRELNSSPGRKTYLFGVEPELAADGRASFEAGHVVQLPAEQTTRTIADGLRTQSVGEIPFSLIRRFVDGIITVSEDEIRDALRRIVALGNPKIAAEPSGAVSVAGFLFHRDQLPDTNINVAVISGGNISPDTLAEILK
ncbi:MAG TPA: threonine/serine dehydratase [Terriglobales bacterium]|nr:threonine/serine dehydratase [Terriglobales bacterium]